MATWTEVKQFLFQNFRVEQDNGSNLLLTVANDQRTQLLSVINTNDFLIFSSPIGEVGKIHPGKILENTPIFGVAQTGNFYQLRNVALLSGIDVEELQLSIIGLAMEADKLEKMFMNGQDIL